MIDGWMDACISACMCMGACSTMPLQPKNKGLSTVKKSMPNVLSRAGPIDFDVSNVAVVELVKQCRMTWLCCIHRRHIP